MMNYLEAALLALTVGASMALGLHLGKRKRAMIRRLLSTAELEFRRIRVESEHPRFCLIGRSAEIIKKIEHVAGQDDSRAPEEVSIHYYVRNPQGEYFFVIIRSDEPPFIKHMSHQAAKAVLKGQYRPVGPHGL